MIMTLPMRTLCIFCGSASGITPAYAAAARLLGTTLAERGIGIVYGGASVGLMGIVADAALAAGGQVIGVIPRTLFEREVGHPGITRLEVVETMHERKARMAALSDGFIAMPGGIGTFEELFEVWTWGQLGIHRKPCALLNAGGFYTPMIAFLDHAVAEGFIKPEARGMLLVEQEVPALLVALDGYVGVAVPQVLTETDLAPEG